MSMFSWLFPADKSSKAHADSAGLSHIEVTRPIVRRTDAKDEAANAVRPGSRKSERLARRELLYSSVRDAMTRAGVLSASYKFKVLSLDARGRQFMVMVDLAREYGTDTRKLAEMEALIEQGAKARHQILVSAVYWRLIEKAAVGVAQTPSRAHPPLAAVPRETPAAAPEPAAAPAPRAVTPGAGANPESAAAGQRAPWRYDPIQADEVAAFKSALAAGAANPAAVAAAAVGVSHAASATTFEGSARQGPQSYTLLTGFEDTEMPDPELLKPALSGSQYGDLN